MRVCDRCKSGLGSHFFEVGKYDFCSVCFNKFQKFENALDEERERKIKKWIREGDKQ